MQKAKEYQVFFPPCAQQSLNSQAVDRDNQTRNSMIYGVHRRAYSQPVKLLDWIRRLYGSEVGFLV